LALHSRKQMILFYLTAKSEKGREKKIGIQNGKTVRGMTALFDIVCHLCIFLSSQHRHKAVWYLPGNANFHIGRQRDTVLEKSVGSEAV
jgi:hypothetical protein